MINDPAYQGFKHRRDEAAGTAVLQPTTPAIWGAVPRWPCSVAGRTVARQRSQIFAVGE
jgi:hypothetical protein